MTPGISVLMAVYNNEKSAGESICSIAEQTFTDWEMIIIDDASTDGTPQILADWARRDVRIRVYSNSENRGLAASLNKALGFSRGGYIARMDGDDVSFPRRFEKQAAFLDSNEQYAIVSSSCVLFDEKGEWGFRGCIERPQKKDFLWGSCFLHPAVMMRRDALISVGGYRVCRDTMRAEDYDLFMRMYAKGYAGYNFKEPLLYYFESRYPKPVSFSARISEAKVRWSGFKELGLLPAGLAYVFKPLAVGMLPRRLKRFLQRRAGGHEEADPDA